MVSSGNFDEINNGSSDELDSNYISVVSEKKNAKVMGSTELASMLSKT